MRTIPKPTPREKQMALDRLAKLEKTVRDVFDRVQTQEQFEQCCTAYAECVISKARITSFPTTN